MKTIIKISLPLLLIALLNGCAFTDDFVRINHNPTAQYQNANTNKTISINELKDLRGGPPKLISHKGAGFKTGGRYMNNINISKLLTKSIRELLSNSGYNISDNANLTLSGNIVKFDSNVIMGFWSGSIEAHIQTNLTLKKANTVVWNESFVGYGIQKGIQLDSWDNREIAIDVALNNLMQNIITSDGFKKAMR